MTNRIRNVHIRNRSMTPAEAELWITVEAEQVTPTTEVRGRLTGPRCVYASTVEVAYPLRPFARPVNGLALLTYRVIIPDPSFWDLESPFVYQGVIELWQDGTRCDQTPVLHGLRDLRLGGQGILLNRKPFFLRGTALYRPDYHRGTIPTIKNEADLRELREEGYNLLLAHREDDVVWELASRLGMLVLGYLEPSEPDLQRAAELAGQPSCLGWLLPHPVMDTGLPAEAISRLRGTRGALLGVELAGTWPGARPEGCDFIVAEPSDFNYLHLPPPVILWGEPEENEPNGVLGRIAFRSV